VSAGRLPVVTTFAATHGYSAIFAVSAFLLLVSLPLLRSLEPTHE
jgi:hypothetical protein